MTQLFFFQLTIFWFKFEKLTSQMSACAAHVPKNTCCKRAASPPRRQKGEEPRGKRRAKLHTPSFLSFSPLSPTLSPAPLPLSLRNDTHASSGYPCHLPLTSCGSRDHVLSVPREPPFRTDHLAAPVMGTGRPTFTVTNTQRSGITTNICIS